MGKKGLKMTKVGGSYGGRYMILTGKALEHFQEWYWNVWFSYKERGYYSNRDEAVEAVERTDKIFMHALIVEWFDSVNINILIRESIGVYWIYYIEYNGEPIYISALKSRKESRNEATKQAIIHANEIYNELF